MINLCFICETEYQILNTVKYVLGNIYEEFGEEQVNTDIYINVIRRISPEVVNNIMNAGVFSNVYTYSYKSIEYDRGISGYIYKINKFVNPKKYVISLCEDIDVTKKYDYIYIAFHSPFVYAMSLTYKRSQIRFIDDGLATYSDLVPRFGFIKGQFRYWIMGVKSPWDSIDKAYVNNVSICKFSQVNELVQLYHPVDDKSKKTINDIFSYSKDRDYDEKRLIFFSQPHETHEPYTIDYRVLEYISTRSDYIVRLHPEDTIVVDEDITVDNSNQMWELLCKDCVNEDTILVGMFSTAQVTPKILYDIEPVIVFTYRMYEEYLSKREIEEFDEVTKRILSLYGSNKVFCPSSMEELMNLVK